MKSLHSCLRQPVFDLIESLDTLHTIQISCEAALDVLNDLTKENNLNNGILSLEKTQLEVLSYIRDLFQPATLQVRHVPMSIYSYYLFNTYLYYISEYPRKFIYNNYHFKS